MMPELFETDGERRRIRVSRWEIALWVVGILLVASGVGALAGLGVTINEESTSTFTNTNATPTQIFLQTASLVAPGLLTGGIVCIALAIFSRVLVANARNSELLAIPAPPSHPQRDAEPATPSGTVSQSPGASTSSTDYSAFMRPTDHGGSDAETGTELGKNTADDTEP